MGGETGLEAMQAGAVGQLFWVVSTRGGGGRVGEVRGVVGGDGAPLGWLGQEGGVFGLVEVRGESTVAFSAKDLAETVYLGVEGSLLFFC